MKKDILTFTFHLIKCIVHRLSNVNFFFFFFFIRSDVHFRYHLNFKVAHKVKEI